MSVFGSVVAETLRMSVPYAMAAAGGVLSEKSGVVNIGLEGILLVSGFASVACALATHSPLVGVVGGLAAGAVVGLAHGLLCARFRVDAIVSGVAVNLAAAGGTRFLLRGWFGSSSNSPGIPALVAIPGGPFARTLLDPLFLLSVVSVVVLARMLGRTRFGLDVRAAGEDPVAAHALGVRVVRTRVLAVTLGSALCALGGVALAYDQHQFQSGMSGGRGFIALAAVILSRWRPVLAVALCLGFASLDALGIVLQNSTHLPPDALTMLPFVATLGSLFFVRRGHFAPAGLGKHAD
jgi:simple sugar transport system permease protein